MVDKLDVFSAIGWRGKLMEFPIVPEYQTLYFIILKRVWFKELLDIFCMFRLFVSLKIGYHWSQDIFFIGLNGHSLTVTILSIKSLVGLIVLASWAYFKFPSTHHKYQKYILWIIFFYDGTSLFTDQLGITIFINAWEDIGFFLLIGFSELYGTIVKRKKWQLLNYFSDHEWRNIFEKARYYH